MAELPEHRAHIDLLRIPEGLRSSGDPVDRNPFRDDDSRHTVWADATRRAEQELRAFNAAIMGDLNDVQPRTQDEARRVIAAHQGQIVTGKFDIWAKRHVHVVWSEPDEQAFAKWLEQYANASLNHIKPLLPAELGNIDSVLEELRTRLIARIEYWKSEARRYLNQQAEERNARVSSSAHAWKLIEQDYTLRLSLVASDWAEEYLRAKNALFQEARARNNAGYLAPAWIDMEIGDADKRAEWAFKTCCEVWDIQGRKKCRPFFRAIFDWCLQPMFSTREGCFEHELERHETRTRPIPQEHSAIFGHMKRQMDHLRAKWNTRLEIETRDTEYRAQFAREREAQGSREIASQAPWSASNITVGIPNPNAERTGAIVAKPETPTANPSSRNKGLLSNYRSEIKRAILIQLTKSPQASDLEICRALDADGAADLPKTWKNTSGDRLFVGAYRDSSRRHLIEIAISKIRADLRKRGLLPDR